MCPLTPRDDPNRPRSSDGEVIVSELGNDFDGIRAYFIARSWTPFRLPVFMVGTLLAAHYGEGFRY
jgi:hypothetical protein